MLENFTTQLIQDCKITPRDAGNGKIEITIEFPEYFNELPLDIQVTIKRAIENAAASGLLNQV